MDKLDFRDEQPEVINLSPEGGLVATLRECIVECLASEKVRNLPSCYALVSVDLMAHATCRTSTCTISCFATPVVLSFSSVASTESGDSCRCSRP
jgi:hypothetical protein